MPRFPKAYPVHPRRSVPVLIRIDIMQSIALIHIIPPLACRNRVIKITYGVDGILDDRLGHIPT